MDNRYCAKRIIFLFLTVVLSVSAGHAQEYWKHISPYPRINPLTSCVFLTKTNIIAVGAEKYIARSADGGASWEVDQIVEYLQTTLTSVAFSDTNRGIVVGIDGAIYATSDGGRTWKNVSKTNKALYAVRYRDAENCFVFGETGKIYTTSDHGTSWNLIESGVTEALRAADFLNDMEGITVGDSGTLLRTRDGGKTWTKLLTPTTQTLEAVAILDTNTYIATSKKDLIRTSDGGKTWAHTLEQGVSMHFSSPLVGTRVHDKILQRTTNGGMTWFDQTWERGYYSGLCAVAFFDDDNGVAVGVEGTIIATSDGGMTWINRGGRMNTDRLMGVSFPIPDIGYVAAWDGRIFKTTTGGYSWNRLQIENTKMLTSVLFLNKDTGWIAGESGLVLRTTDGGEHWKELLTEKTATLTALSFRDADNGLAVGYGGVIYRTTDGGDTWKRLESGVKSILTGVEWTSEHSAIAIGWYGIVLQTLDGGIVWRPRYSPVPYNFNGISFSDQNTGVAVADEAGSSGSSNNAIRTTDGGFSWRLITKLASSRLFSVSVGDANNIIATTAYKILASTDGGKTWSHEQRDAYVKSSVFVNPLLAYMAGNLAHVWRYSLPKSLSPRISLSSNSIGFAWVWAGKTEKRTIRIWNTGSETLVLRNVYVTGQNSAQMQVEEIRNLNLPSLEYTTIEIRFSPESEGDHSAELIIESNDPDSPLAVIPLSGRGAVPALRLEENIIEFDSIAVLSSKETSFSIENIDYLPRVITYRFREGDTDQFQFPSPCDTIAPGQKKTVFVRFVPTSEGEKSATVWLDMNDQFLTPTTIRLHGTSLRPVLGLNRPSIDFDTVHTAVCRSDTIIVRNNGSTTLNIQRVEVTGADADNFIIGKSGKNLVDPGDSTFQILHFCPITRGRKTATISFLTNDPLKIIYDLNLSGIGISANLSISRPAMNFGDVFLSRSKGDTITLRSVGEDPVMISRISIAGRDTSSFRIRSVGNPVIQPGKSRIVTLDFVPRNEGLHEATLLIESNTFPQSYGVELSGMGIKPVFFLDVDALQFGAVCIADTIERTLSFGNNEDRDLPIPSMIIEGIHAEQFQIVPPSMDTVASRTSVPIKIRFAPVIEGAITSELKFLTSDLICPANSLPLTGTGGSQKIFMNYSSVSFGTVLIDRIYWIDLVVRNNGTCPLNIYSCNIDGEHADQFHIASPCEAVLNPNESHTIRLQYIPILLGGMSARLHIYSNDFSYPEIIIPLSGISVLTSAPSGNELPATIALGQNHPNPVCSGSLVEGSITNIPFTLSRSGDVRLTVHTILGEEIATLVSRHVEAGEHVAQWDTAGLRSGVYFYRLQVGSQILTRKMIIM